MDLLNEEDQLTNLELEIDGDAKQSLDIAAYWAKFISIFIFSAAAFVIILLVALSGAFMQGFQRAFGSRFSIFDEASGGVFLAAMFIGLLLIGVVYYFLFNFANKTKMALVAENIDELNKGFSSLKTYFIIMGVLGILGILTTLFTLSNLF